MKQTNENISNRDLNRASLNEIVQVRDKIIHSSTLDFVMKIEIILAWRNAGTDLGLELQQTLALFPN